jgi:hypothetical protein
VYTFLGHSVYYTDKENERKKINTSPVFVQNVDKAGGTVIHFLICMEMGFSVLC